MRAAVITAAGKVGVEDWPGPVAGDGEVLIKLRRAALNQSRRPMPPLRRPKSPCPSVQWI